MDKIIMQIPARHAFHCPILIEPHLLDHPNKWLSTDFLGKSLVIITDENVRKFYGNNLLHNLMNYNPLLLSFAPGEKSKNYQTKQYLEEKMFQHQCGRETLILALGGGVVNDMAGFIAATYMRGISYIQIPTTFLSMIDSSVGGKTGIDTVYGKNLIGAFWQPASVIIDRHCLTTLSRNHFVNGLIEALKIFMTSDASSFQYVTQHLDEIINQDTFMVDNIIRRAIKIKIDIVSKDEKDNNLRMILNFGHTIGHALEKQSDYTLLHGYAVALGILVEAKISQLSGLFSLDDYKVIQSLFLKLGICGSWLKTIDREEVIEATKLDKKIKSGKVRYILLKKWGQVCSEDNNYAHFVPDNMVKKALLEVSEV
ncbi:MAG: aroB [Gammaproteobacteria bacterium]|jgi:3-dehydroquinate synthase|nr:aroB [Gammaproteobacteria bacterium]